MNVTFKGSVCSIRNVIHFSVPPYGSKWLRLDENRHMNRTTPTTLTEHTRDARPSLFAKVFYIFTTKFPAQTHRLGFLDVLE